MASCGVGRASALGGPYHAFALTLPRRLLMRVTRRWTNAR